MNWVDLPGISPTHTSPHIGTTIGIAEQGDGGATISVDGFSRQIEAIHEAGYTAPQGYRLPLRECRNKRKERRRKKGC